MSGKTNPLTTKKKKSVWVFGVKKTERENQRDESASLGLWVGFRICEWLYGEGP